MIRYTNNQRTIAIAVMIILLCLVSIVGLTLALFTNDVQDGTIGINATAGKLKVDIVDTTDEHNSLVGEYFRFDTGSDDANPEMHTVLFEPGAFYYTEGFQVENEGNIDMRYIVYISTQNLQSDVNFEDAFEVWITDEPPTGREIPDNITDLRDFSGTLKAGELSKTYYLVVKMKENADNRFNKHREYAGIGITVCAVQGNVNLTDPPETQN